MDSSYIINNEAESSVKRQGNNPALTAIQRMKAAGFKMEADGGKLRIFPAERLTPEQRAWIAGNKAEIVAALELVSAEPAIADMAALFDATVLSVSPALGRHSLSPVSVNPELLTRFRHYPACGRVCCAECRHSEPIPNSDAYSWRTCGAGHGGGFSRQWRHCEGYQVA